VNRHNATTRNKFIRRNQRDSSQQVRHGVQAFFLLLNLWIGLQFYLFVRWAETGGRTPPVSRPAGVEGWLPIEGMMQFKYTLLTRQLPRVHPAAFFLFAAFALSSLLFRKSFCGWLCPVGTVSEYLWKLGRRIFARSFTLPSWLDYPLRSLKYLLLSFFLYAVVMMSAADIADFVASPYGLVVDVRMLNFFRFMGSTTAIVLGGLALASLFVRNVWCRFLCPYGALLGLISMFSPLRISRNQSACIDCANCAKACPSVLPVDKLVHIRSAECIGCLECVSVCPAQNALSLNLIGATGSRRRISAWQIAAGIAIIFFGLVGGAKLTGHWQTNSLQQVFLRLVPTASEQQHPMIGETRD
jgi:polyferredoxin